MVPADDGASPAPIDRLVMEWMRSRFAGSRMRGRLYLHVELSGDYYLGEVSARFEICWYRNDDFAVHYQEERQDRTWKCQWDRHPNAHNSRDHFHPAPTASHTVAADAQWPSDHRNVCRFVLEDAEQRIETLWGPE